MAAKKKSGGVPKSMRSTKMPSKRNALASVKAVARKDKSEDGPVKGIKSDKHMAKSQRAPKEPKHEAFDHHTTPSQKPNMAMPGNRGSVKAYRKKK